MRRLLQFVVLLVGLAWCVPVHATWTLVQQKNSASASASPIAVTVTSTGSGNLLVAAVENQTSTATAISAVTAGACNTTWTHAPSTNGVTPGAVDMYYCTSSASGQTSISITSSGCASATCAGVIWEASSSLGTIAIDSGATPSGLKSDTTCTACAGVALTLSGNNDFTAAIASCGGSCSSPVTGAGCIWDASLPGSDGAAHCITSGSITAPATWSQTSGTLLANAAAFQETSAGGAVSGISKRRKLDAASE